MVQITALSDVPPLKLDRVFVFGGAYGNLQATEAILSEAKRRGFSSDEIIFTGDCVAYCGQPQETADLIRLSGVNTIMGNCEEALANDFDAEGDPLTITHISDQPVTAGGPAVTLATGATVQPCRGHRPSKPDDSRQRP